MRKLPRSLSFLARKLRELVAYFCAHPTSHNQILQCSKLKHQYTFCSFQDCRQQQTQITNKQIRYLPCLVLVCQRRWACKSIHHTHTQVKKQNKNKNKCHSWQCWQANPNSRHSKVHLTFADLLEWENTYIQVHVQWIGWCDTPLLSHILKKPLIHMYHR